jgi:MFS transporter, FHS family, L-fucose permease
MAKNYTYSLIIICFLFFCFGFITWVNGVLIPYFKICLELTNFQASLVMFASYTAYFVMALPSASIIKKTGYKKGMVLGLIVMAIGTALFIPAAYTRAYSLFLIGLFVTGSGLALLQTASNPYVAVIGPIESTAQRVGFLGVSNKLAGIFSILVLGGIFLLNADEITASIANIDTLQKGTLLDNYVLKVVTPYCYITAAILALAVMIHFSNLPEIDDTVSNDDASSTFNSKNSIIEFPHLILGSVCIFCAVACEVIPVDGVILYSKSIGFSISDSIKYPTYSLFAMVVGYIFSIVAIPKYISQERALAYSAIWGIAMIIIAYFSGGIASIYCLIAMGISNAMLWGTIWGLAMKNLGKFTKTGSAILIMGIVGGALVPPLFGKLIDLYPKSPGNALLITIPFLLFLLYYGMKGHKLEKWS